MLARTDQVRSVAEAREARVSATDCEDGEAVLLATGRLEDFRSCYATIRADEDGVAIDAQAARTLGVGKGDTVWRVAR